jgi:septal ring factor EnvC (AmiA/AmiB activator)
MPEMTQEEIEARLEQIKKELEELEHLRDAEEPAELEQHLVQVETAHDRLKLSLEALERETERLSRLAETA